MLEMNSYLVLYKSIKDCLVDISWERFKEFGNGNVISSDVLRSAKSRIVFMEKELLLIMFEAVDIWNNIGETLIIRINNGIIKEKEVENGNGKDCLKKRNIIIMIVNIIISCLNI